MQRLKFDISEMRYGPPIKEPCSPGRGLLLFSSTPRNETGDMPRENCQTMPVTL